MKAYKYYLFEYPQDCYSILLGHGCYHSHSDYGKRIYSIIATKKLVPADVGYGAVFLYFGIGGLFCILLMFFHVFKTRILEEDKGVKLWFYFMLLGNIFSIMILESQICIALGLYVLYESENAFLDTT